MIDCGSLEYAQARLQARHGQRPDETAWHRIEVMRDFAPMLELARATALRPWLAGITAATSAHEIELRLRSRWRARVAEVQGWMPLAWQPAVAWCAVLPDLAPLQHLARGLDGAPWMPDEPSWRELAQVPPASRAALLRKGSWAPLASAWAAPDTMVAVWLAEWRRRLPQRSDEIGDPLSALLRTLAGHGHSFAVAASAQGWLLRGALQARLVVLLRRAALEPAAVFIDLALAALEMERLRAELLRRVLFARWKVA